MQKQITSWYSPALNKEMPIVSYGHYGFALLLIPTAAADFLEYERFQLIDALSPMIEGGKLRVFSIDSMNRESWMNNGMIPEHKAIRHNQFNEYVFNEVVPYIRNCTSNETFYLYLRRFVWRPACHEPFFKETRCNQWSHQHERCLRPY